MKAVGDGHGKWRQPWRMTVPAADRGGRSGRRLPRRMEAAMADGAAPSVDESDSDRAVAAHGAAPVVGESDRDEVAVADSNSLGERRRRVADGGGCGGQRQRWRMEAALRELRGPWWTPWQRILCEEAEW